MHSEKEYRKQRETMYSEHPLWRFLLFNKLTYRDFAEQIGSTTNAVKAWCLYKKEPTIFELALICYATAGLVKITDFISPSGQRYIMETFDVDQEELI